MKKDIGLVCCDLLDRIDFGDIDGMYDPNLESYFIDRGYLEHIFRNNRFYIIGRKGTGKSALYNWIQSTAGNNGDICINVLFNEFPFQRLLELKDDSFAQPYQYQTICKNMILGQFAASIVLDANHEDCEEYKQLVYYVHNILGEGVEDCFRRTVSRVKQESGALVIPYISSTASKGTEEQYGFESCNLSQLNIVLQKTITDYFKIYKSDSRFMIQVDGIDENYNQITTQEQKINEYMQLIISLMKSVYGINQNFHRHAITNAKCIIYLRSDIFNNIHEYDPESARWEQNRIVLSWVVEGHRWANNDLRVLLNARIIASLEFMNGWDGFSEAVDYRAVSLMQKSGKTERSLFEYMVNRTFHRPRDILQFMIKIKEASVGEKALNYKAFSMAEKEYSLWFLSEITNEISPKIKNTKELFSFLRLIGAQEITKTTFKKRYEKFESKIGLSADNLLNYLYSVAIISNVNDKGEWFSIIRNEKSTFNPDIKLILHPGFWKGIYAATF